MDVTEGNLSTHVRISVPPFSLSWYQSSPDLLKKLGSTSYSSPTYSSVSVVYRLYRWSQVSTCTSAIFPPLTKWFQCFSHFFRAVVLKAASAFHGNLLKMKHLRSYYRLFIRISWIKARNLWFNDPSSKFDAHLGLTSLEHLSSYS